MGCRYACFLSLPSPCRLAAHRLRRREHLDRHQWLLVENDCPRGQSCLVGQCRVVVCSPNELRCSGNNLEACDPTGQRYELRAICPSGCDEESASCRMPVCAAYASRCYEGNVERCLANGEGWTMEQSCGDLGCEAGSCVSPTSPVCEAEATRCIGDNVERCNDQQDGWIHAASCLFGCAGGECALSACDAGSSRCEGSDLLACSSDRRSWEYRRTCDFGCDDGQCLPACGAGRSAATGINCNAAPMATSERPRNAPSAALRAPARRLFVSGGAPVRRRRPRSLRQQSARLAVHAHL